jgi:hypothetical protein
LIFRINQLIDLLNDWCNFRILWKHCCFEK